jgi:imidazole glycerol phosphate synthase subunit HisF
MNYRRHMADEIIFHEITRSHSETEKGYEAS